MSIWNDMSIENEKYSKPSWDLTFKVEDYVSGNDKNLSERMYLNKIYMSQPKRTKCKVCFHSLEDSPWFESFKIKYFMCADCEHLNGEFEDTEEFSNHLYSDLETSTYEKNYSTDFELRVEKIYVPKILHLLESVPLTSSEIRLLDIGCGGGHFVKAALENKIDCLGLETNYELVKIGSANVGHNSIKKISNYEDLAKHVEIFKPNVVSFVGVLEHLTDMDSFLKLCRLNDVKYIYVSVPLFSLTSILQCLNEEVFPRQLSGGHTHLFSDKSLRLLLGRHSYHAKSSWWFGSDSMDMQRMLALTLKNRSKNLDLILSKVLTPVIDEIQGALDRSRRTSEVHMLFEIEGSK
jgi:hypothetical protein